ncbi:hypothetical protein AS29_012560 [Bacillus sp. SJS]|nr:hypothetical protein AS29_012560 [Bacillus sp. SJS]
MQGIGGWHVFALTPSTAPRWGNEQRADKPLPGNALDKGGRRFSAIVERGSVHCTDPPYSNAMGEQAKSTPPLIPVDLKSNGDGGLIL